MSLRSRIVWQRVPVAAMRITSPQSEERFWLAYCTLYFFASILTGWVIHKWRMPFWGAASLTQDVTYIFFFKLLLLLAIPLIAHRRMGYRVADLTPGWQPGVRAFGAMAIACLVGFSLNLGHIPWQAEASVRFAETGFWARVAVAPALSFLMAGFPEEFVFRGVLQTRVEAVRGRLLAISITAALFTAWHIPPRYFNATGVEGEAGNLASVLLGTGAPVFVVGLIFGLIWDRYRSFWPLVAAHTGVDTLPILSSLLGIPR